jgi:hypothetical protein
MRNNNCDEPLRKYTTLSAEAEEESERGILADHGST